MNPTEWHALILSGVVTLVGKIVWDWLSARNGKRNGSYLYEKMEHMSTLQSEMNERQKKIWEYLLDHPRRR